MKKIFTLLLTLSVFTLIQAQVCTTTGFATCDAASGISSDFRNAVQVTGTGHPLTTGAKYKFNNAIPVFNLDAIISIDTIVNATMQGAINPSIDDDAAVNETNVAGSQAALFAPRIAPDQKLSCTDRSGYVEFSIKFYTHYNGTALPAAGTEIAVQNLNFLNFDMDGFTVGNNGWFKETGYVRMSDTDPYNYYAPNTELTDGPFTSGWLLTYGSTADRTTLARCNEVIERSVYIEGQTAIYFRMGYSYKAPDVNCNNSIQPTRDYGAKVGCFTLKASGPLPVSLINFAAASNTGKVTLSWTSLQENNLKGYEIQRSVDGINFEVAGNITANNLSSVQQYAFTDDVAAISSKYIYYRIRIVDLDHSMKLTNSISVKTAEPRNNTMTISPNPSSAEAQVKIKLTKAGTGALVVFDASGKTVLKQQVNLSAGSNSVVINNSNSFAEGYYTVRLIVNEESFSSKLLIWK